MDGFFEDCEKNVPITTFKNSSGNKQPISRTTPINVLNAATIIVLDRWPQLCNILHQIMAMSIDKVSMPYIIPDTIGTVYTIRSMYFDSIKFHRCSSEAIIGIKVSNFNNPNSFPTHVGEPPLAYLERLRIIMQEINDMAVDESVVPINPTSLKLKFLASIKLVPQYASYIKFMNVNEVYDVFGHEVPITVDRYAKKLQTVFLEMKEDAHRHRANVVREEEFPVEESVNFAKKVKFGGESKFPSKPSGFSNSFSKPQPKDFSKSAFDKKNSSKQVCYAFRDTGKCKYGDRCMYQHSSTTALHVATKEEMLDQ